MKTRLPLVLRASVVVALTASAGGCNFLERLSEVGEPPRVSRIQDPTQTAGYQPVSMPMPTPTAPQSGANSLWRPGARAFFKDQRATEVGDILTVSVNINESGQLTNKTQVTTANSETMGAPSMLGFEQSVGKVFAGANASSLVNLNSASGLNGSGTMQRQEQVTINLAAVVSQKLPNGNLVITGKQELRIGGDMRELSVQGIIRIEDISSLNTITSDKIAEARVYYGGRGMVSDITQPRYVQEIFDIIFPF